MIERNRRRVAASAILAASGFVLSGCMSGPTYGTDKTSTEQLVGDVSGILSLAPKSRPQIDYKPRPELVKPVKGEIANLPTPQDSVAVTDNPAWPESPEQMRARLRADATENRDKPGFKPQIQPDAVAVASASGGPMSSRGEDSGIEPTTGMSAAQKSAEFKRQLAVTQQGSDTKRRLLSEPPLEYRKPSETAQVGDLGEDEIKKERRRKAAARKAGGGSSWADLWPF